MRALFNIQSLSKKITWPAIALAINTVSTFIFYKIIAIMSMGSLIPIVAHFQNLVNIFTGPAIDGPNTASLREISANKQNIPQALAAALLFNIGLIILTTVLSILFRSYIFKQFSNEYLGGFPIFIVFIIAVVLQMTFNLLNNVLLGLGRLRSYGLLLILCSFLSLGYVAINMKQIDMPILLTATSFNCLPAVCILLYISITEKWFRLLPFTHIKKELTLMLKFLIMGIGIAFFGKVSMFIIRDYLLINLGANETSLWQAVVKISEGYSGLYLALMSSVFFPYISSLLPHPEQLGVFIRKFISIAFIILTPIFILLYLGRFEILTLFYNENFQAAADLFTIQLIIDFIKMISWALGFLMYAQARAGLFFFLELISYSILLGMTAIFVNTAGIIGVAYAELIQYLVYSMALFIIYRKLLLGKNA